MDTGDDINLVDPLDAGRLACAAPGAFDTGTLPVDNPNASPTNVSAPSEIGYVTIRTCAIPGAEAAEDVLSWLAGRRHSVPA